MSTKKTKAAPVSDKKLDPYKADRRRNALILLIILALTATITVAFWIR